MSETSHRWVQVWVLAAILCTSSTLAIGTDPRSYDQQMIQDPLRAVGTNRVSLMPLFAWIKKQRTANSYADVQGIANPMPQWLGIRSEVMRVTPQGVLVKPFGISARGDRVYRETALIKNIPTEKIAELTDLLVVARDAGVTDYTDTRGVTRRVRCFDYGLPYVGKK